jgi:hypothetical protein
MNERVAAGIIAMTEHGPQVSVFVLWRSTEMFSEQREVTALVKLQGSGRLSD